MKNVINRLLRPFNLEVHGRGYLQKLRASQIDKDAYNRQRELLDGSSTLHIIDAGANRGDTAKRYLALFPQAKVHCFEPTPQIAEGLRHRFRDQPRVQVTEAALTCKSGSTTLNINTSQDTNSLLESTSIHATSDALCKTVSSVEVRTVTLDDYADENEIPRVDLLKMDVQGSELQLLRGARSLIDSNRIRLIYTEAYFQRQYLGQPLLGDLCHFLEVGGFELVDLFDPYYNADCMLWCDAIFRRKANTK